VPLAAYFAPLRRHPRLLAACCGVGLAIGLVTAAARPTVWTSSTSVLAPKVPLYTPIVAQGVNEREPKPVTVDTEAQILTSRRVLLRATAGTDVTPDQLARMATVVAPPNSRVLQVTVRDTERDRAPFLADALTDAYLDARLQQLTERRSQQAEALRRRVATLEAGEATGMSTLLRTAEQQGAQPVTDEVDRSELDRLAAQNLADQIQQLRSQVLQLEGTEVVGGEALRSASPPAAAGRHPEVPMVSWLLLGLLAGLAGTRFLERHPLPPRSVADAVRLRELRELPVGVVDPAGAGGNPTGWNEIAEAVGTAPATVMVVPPDGDEAAATAAAWTLAWVLRGRGHPVAVVTHGSEGSDDVRLARAVHRLLERPRHVVIAWPALTSFEQSLAATEANPVLLVAAAGRTGSGTLRAAARRVTALGVPVAGLVLVRARNEPGARWRPWAAARAARPA
jgi:hypothetical protein